MEQIIWFALRLTGRTDGRGGTDVGVLDSDPVIWQTAAGGDSRGKSLELLEERSPTVSPLNFWD